MDSLKNIQKMAFFLTTFFVNVIVAIAIYLIVAYITKLLVM